MNEGEHDLLWCRSLAAASKMIGGCTRRQADLTSLSSWSRRQFSLETI